MTTPTKELLALVGAALLLSGCSPRPAATGNVTQAAEGPLTVLHDKKRGVTCYWRKVGYGAGLSCIPDSQLAAKEPK